MLCTQSILSKNESEVDRLESMAVLLAAVEAGSLSAAGRKLGMPLATVSRKVADLESHLNARLLNRSSRKLTLTDAGEAYVAACRRILDAVEEAERDVAGEYVAPRGELTISAPVLFGALYVMPIVIAFLEAFPEIDMRVMLSDRVVNLLEERVDVAVRSGELPDSSLRARRLGTIRRVICGSPAYLQEHGTPVDPSELSAHTCITFESLAAADAWRFVVNQSESSVAVRSRLIVDSAQSAVDAARAGIGVTRVLSYQIAHACRSGELEVVLSEFEPPPWPVNLVYASGRYQPIKVRAFLDFAAPRLQNGLRELKL